MDEKHDALTPDYFTINILPDKIIFETLAQWYFIVPDIYQLIVERGDMKDIDDIRFTDPRKNRRW